MGVCAGVEEPKGGVEARRVRFAGSGVDRGRSVERRALGGSVKAEEPARSERPGIAGVARDGAAVHEGRDETAFPHREPGPAGDKVAPADHERPLDENSQPGRRASGRFIAIGA
jgi:hypothetical protein